MDSIADARREYTAAGLTEEDLSADPFDLFGRWYDQAAPLLEPNAMVVATVDPDGTPSARMVLLKGVSPAGFTFYTHLTSRKGRALTADHRVALLFPWHQVERQIRIEGTAQEVARDEVEAYFASRPRSSQVGAWASPQSEPVAGREELADRYTEAAARFDGVEMPAPPQWGGYRVRPDSFEFWQGRPGRMHDRLTYRRDGAAWVTGRLAP